MPSLNSYSGKVRRKRRAGSVRFSSDGGSTAVNVGDSRHVPVRGTALRTMPLILLRSGQSGAIETNRGGDENVVPASPNAFNHD